MQIGFKNFLLCGAGELWILADAVRCCLRAVGLKVFGCRLSCRERLKEGERGLEPGRLGVYA